MSLQKFPSRKLWAAIRRSALHEIGHVFCAWRTARETPVSRDKRGPSFEKVTRTRGTALGYVINPHWRGRSIYGQRTTRLPRVRCLLGGRAAEELTGGKAVSPRSGDDSPRPPHCKTDGGAVWARPVFGPAAIMAEADYPNANGGSVLPGMEQEVSWEASGVPRNRRKDLADTHPLAGRAGKRLPGS